MKKYSFKINLIADSKLIIPEYKIELLNKSKKVINTIESIDKIKDLDKTSKINGKLIKLDDASLSKKVKKTKIIKKKIQKPRTLWVRRRKKLN